MVYPKEGILIMMLDSAIHISGDFRMSSGCTLRIDHGILHLGKDVGIGGGCKVLCNNKITIGDYTRVAFGCVITDTDFHYISMNNIVKDCSRPVIIHDRVWIGNNCAVGKGTILPPQSILATRSMANKDYSNYGNGILFAGIPAKVIRTGCYKIHNRKIEKQIHQHYFSTNEVYIITKKEFDKSQIR